MGKGIHIPAIRSMKFQVVPQIMAASYRMSQIGLAEFGVIQIQAAVPISPNYKTSLLLSSLFNN